jgi:hypothetical protein
MPPANRAPLGQHAGARAAMRYGVIAENPLERVGLAAGLVPTPRIDG